MSKTRLSILVIDDEPALREVLSVRINSWGYSVRAAADTVEAQAEIEREKPDLIVSDVILPGMSGVDFLRQLRTIDRNIPVILITAHGNIDAAVEAMKAGASDFLTKPIDYETLRALLDAAADEIERQAAVEDIAGGAAQLQAVGGIVGQSKAMKDLQRMVQVLAESDASAIITGPSGTGKEVIARAIHSLSARKDMPFVAINAAAIPEGLIESEIFGHEQGAFTGANRARPGCFELADGGTLFLDEIAEMPMQLQPKLLRILEDGKARRLGGSKEIQFDVRVIAATNRELSAAVKDGLLREDLFYRLSVFDIALPPLHQREGDIALLTRHFIRQFSQKHNIQTEGINSSAQALLEAHPWPGNVRELRNVIERALIIAKGGWIEPQHLPMYLQSIKAGSSPTIQLPAGTTLAEAEKLLIMQTLERTGNNKAETARQLGLDVKTIRNKLKSYGISD